MESKRESEEIQTPFFHAIGQMWCPQAMVQCRLSLMRKATERSLRCASQVASATAVVTIATIVVVRPVTHHRDLEGVD